MPSPSSMPLCPCLPSPILPFLSTPIPISIFYIFGTVSSLPGIFIGTRRPSIPTFHTVHPRSFTLTIPVSLLHPYIYLRTLAPVFRGFHSQDGRTPRISVAGEFDAPRGNCGVARERESHPRGFTPRPPLNGRSTLVKAHPPRSR
jgi:hypothetical protein